jgi:hypothetical protein
VGPRAVLHAVVKRKIPTPAGNITTAETKKKILRCFLLLGSLVASLNTLYRLEMLFSLRTDDRTDCEIKGMMKEVGVAYLRTLYGYISKGLRKTTEASVKTADIP